MTYEICSEGKLSQAQQKTNKIWVENIFTETELPVQNIKNCLGKLPIKLYTKKKN